MGRNICISVKTLYDLYGTNLKYCTISTKEKGYYDLKTEEAGIVCMDGETCTILSEINNEIILVNENGETPTTFRLTREELEVASFV